jgi:hypothetical protein
MSLYVEGDVPYVTNGNCNNGAFGNNGDWIWAFLLFALLGNGGLGYGGGFGGGYRGGVGENYVLATDFATIERKLDGVNNGLCDGFYAQNTNMLNGFASVQQTLCQGFNGIERSIADTNSNLANSICTLGYQNQAGFNALANQIASCCCDLKTMNLESRYLNEKQTCDIVNAINMGNQRLVDIYTSDKIEALRAENTALRGQISDDRQADRIINKLSPCPSPSYIVPNPNCCYNYGVYPVNNGCCGASVQ